MKIIRNKEMPSITIYNENNNDYMHIFKDLDSLIFVISCKEPIKISNELDEQFFYSISWLLSNDYTFIDNPTSFKNNSYLKCISDGSIRIKDPKQRSEYFHLIIEKKESNIYFSCTPTEEISKIPSVISFNLKNEGYRTINNISGSTMQEDMLYSFNLALEDNFLKEQESKKKRRII